MDDCVQQRLRAAEELDHLTTSHTRSTSKTVDPMGSEVRRSKPARPPETRSSEIRPDPRPTGGSRLRQRAAPTGPPRRCSYRRSNRRTYYCSASTWSLESGRAGCPASRKKSLAFSSSSSRASSAFPTEVPATTARGWREATGGCPHALRSKPSAEVRRSAGQGRRGTTLRRRASMRVHDRVVARSGSQHRGMQKRFLGRLRTVNVRTRRID